MVHCVEVTVEFDMKDVEPVKNSQSYMINWIDGGKRQIETNVVKFATQTIAEAMFSINGLFILYPEIRNVHINQVIWK